MRLIDAEKLEGEAICLYTYGGARYIPLDALKRAPTVELPRWIPVTERLPQEDEPPETLCELFNLRHSDGYVTAGWCNRSSGKWHYIPHDDDFIATQGLDSGAITHWMPLPERPKED